MTILAIDVGSSSVRVALFDRSPSGVSLIFDAVVRKDYQFESHEPGASVIDPELLKHKVEASIDEILLHPAASEIEGVGIDTFAGNLMLVGHNNEPLTPVSTYADTRGTQNIGWIRRKVDQNTLFQRTGVMLSPAYWPAQLPLYDYPHNAEPFVISYLDFGTYLYRNWFESNIPMSYSICAWNGMLNRLEFQWDSELLKVLNVPKMMLPPLADYSTAQRGLRKVYAQRWPKLANVPFYLPVGDGAAAQVGSGAVSPRTASLTVGTTSAIRSATTEDYPTVPGGCWSYVIDRSTHLQGGALSEGGNIFLWASETLQLDLTVMGETLRRREPGLHGLTVLPLLNGERSPGWQGDATGTIHGITLQTTPMDVMHALLESVALRLATIATQLEIDEDTRIMASGGALLASPAWQQIIADSLQRPLHIIAHTEITALGTAHLVHCGLNKTPLTGASPEVLRVIQPRTEYAQEYRKLQAEQRRLYTRFYS